MNLLLLKLLTQYNKYLIISNYKNKFDVILNMEVVEHVSDINLFIEKCSKLLTKQFVVIRIKH